MRRSSFCSLVVLAACMRSPGTSTVGGEPRTPSRGPVTASPSGPVGVDVVVPGDRLFGITSDGYAIYADASKLRAVDVRGEKRHEIGECSARSCPVEIRGRWVFVGNDGNVVAWTAAHGAHSLGGDAMGHPLLGSYVAVNTAGDRIAFCRLESESTRCFGANAPTLEPSALDLGRPTNASITLLGTERIVFVSGERARLFDRDWKAVALTLPPRFSPVSGYRESIVDPDGKNVFGRIEGKFAAVPLTGDPARPSLFGEVPGSEEAIRGKAGWRILLAMKRGAVALEKRAVTFWNADDRKTTKLDTIDQRELVAGLVAVAPDEKHVLYVAEQGAKVASLDGAHRPIAIPGIGLQHREAFTVDAAHVLTIDTMTRAARASHLEGGAETLVGERVQDMRPFADSRVVVCDHRKGRSDERGTCDVAIVDAKTGARTDVATGVRTGEDLEDDMGLDRTFAVGDGHIAYVTAQPPALVVKRLP